jgi:hypothetical protein
MAEISFIERLRRVVAPTKTQVLWFIVLALGIIVVFQSQPLLHRLGITQAALDASSAEFHARFGVILQSGVASQIALVTFWALVGLIAYIICWGAYNILIEARNEVTLNTAYSNRGHWRGAYETMALKTVAAVGLATVVASLWTGVSFWLALSAQVFTEPSLSSAGLALAGVLGLALQLYAVLAFIQLTFTPWYRAESFTDIS